MPSSSVNPLTPSVAASTATMFVGSLTSITVTADSWYAAFIAYVLEVVFDEIY